MVARVTSLTAAFACLLLVLPTHGTALAAAAAVVAIFVCLCRPFALQATAPAPVAARSVRPLMRQHAPSVAGKTRARAPGCGL